MRINGEHCTAYFEKKLEKSLSDGEALEMYQTTLGTVFHPVLNKEGKEKFQKLVEICQSHPDEHLDHSVGVHGDFLYHENSIVKSDLLKVVRDTTSGIDNSELDKNRRVLKDALDEISLSQS